MEQLHLEAPDLDVLSKVIHLYSYCLAGVDLMDESQREKEILQVMIQFCYNDDIRVRRSVIRVFEEALKCSKNWNRGDLIELLASVPHILHNQLV